ncbi:hypothetical protein [Streptomyces sp. NPDC005876]|uniref:hypothetical protein n=1 Tax=unclassified Streptomyces TaxID=2593676 RepID=UPI003406EA79
MTTDTRDETVLRRPETGWSEARRRRTEGALRTWIPAVDDAGPARTPRPVPESNIVRGED